MFYWILAYNGELIVYVYFVCQHLPLYFHYRCASSEGVFHPFINTGKHIKTPACRNHITNTLQTQLTGDEIAND